MTVFALHHVEVVVVTCGSVTGDLAGVAGPQGREVRVDYPRAAVGTTGLLPSAARAAGTPRGV